MFVNVAGGGRHGKLLAERTVAQPSCDAFVPGMSQAYVLVARTNTPNNTHINVAAGLAARAHVEGATYGNTHARTHAHTHGSRAPGAWHAALARGTPHARTG